MSEKDSKNAKRYMRAMEERKRASMPYSVRPERDTEEVGAPQGTVEKVDTGVISVLPDNTHTLEAGAKLAAYVENNRELLENVLSQHRAGGEEFVRSYLMGHFSPKLKLKRSLELTRPAIIKQMLSILMRKERHSQG